jgi:hypothetical protein
MKVYDEEYMQAQSAAQWGGRQENRSEPTRGGHRGECRNRCEKTTDSEYAVL